MDSPLSTSGGCVRLTSKWTDIPARSFSTNITHRSLLRHSCYGQVVRWASDTPASPVQHLGVDHRGRHIPVP